MQVSTHGYSQNQILVWKYPSLTQVAKLTGHSYRVLYLVSAVSRVYTPDRREHMLRVSFILYLNKDCKLGLLTHW